MGVWMQQFLTPIANPDSDYDHESLTKLFKKYGPVDIIISKKRGRAVAAFSSSADAVCHVTSLNLLIKLGQ